MCNVTGRRRWAGAGPPVSRGRADAPSTWPRVPWNLRPPHAARWQAPRRSKWVGCSRASLRCGCACSSAMARACGRRRHLTCALKLHLVRGRPGTRDGARQERVRGVSGARTADPGGHTCRAGICWSLSCGVLRASCRVGGGPLHHARTSPPAPRAVPRLSGELLDCEACHVGLRVVTITDGLLHLL